MYPFAQSLDFLHRAKGFLNRDAKGCEEHLPEGAQAEPAMWLPEGAFWRKLWGFTCGET